ncbi:MAG: hypothetical protein OXH31_01035 [Gammaproteobacteria bacterium]|nr:hypothetical protein [Gammaproteobacteria bacterium]
MKKLLLPLPLVLLTFGFVANNVFAGDRVILGSLERLTEEYDDPYVSVSLESAVNGFSAKFYRFQSYGLYTGLDLVRMTGDIDVCFQSNPSNCSQVDVKVTMFSAEFGWALGRWIPFVGRTFSQTTGEETGIALIDSENRFGVNPSSVVERTADKGGRNIGLWIERDTFKVKGALKSVDGNEPMSVSGGVLFQMDNKFAVGAEFEIQLDSEAEGFRFSLQFGRSF